MIKVIAILFFVLVFLTPLPLHSEDLEQEKEQIRKIDILLKELDEIKKEEPRISLRALNVPLSYVLESISKSVGESFVIDKNIDLTKDVTVDIKDTPVSVALKKVLAPIGLSYRYSDDFFFIYELDERTWTIPMPPIKSSFNNIISNENQAGTSPSGSGGYRGYGSAIPGTSGSATPGTSVGSTILHRAEYNPEDFWKNLEATLKKMVSPQKGIYSIDPIGGIVHVRDNPAKLSEIDNYLSTIDKELRKKVLIEVKVIEVFLSEGHEIGVDWDVVIRKALAYTNVGAVSTLATENLKSPLYFTVDTNMWRSSFSGLVKLLEGFGDVNITSQPSLLVGNNEAAVIMSGNMKTYIANVTRSVTGATSTESYSVSTGRVQDGVTLSIIPRILEEGVYLNVTPVISDIKEIRTIAFGNTIIEAPDTIVRSMNTSVMLRDGETLVIGGLIVNKEKKDKGGIPILSRIPVLGGLFGYEKSDKIKSDIAVIVTPKIVRD